MDIVVDNDRSLKYETNSLYRRVFNFFFIPALNILPSRSRKFIGKSHRSVGEVVENATTHKALEVLYKKGHKSHTVSVLQKILHAVWFDTNNSKAVRNRLRLVERELSGSIRRIFGQVKDVKILSIASGSARAIVESVENSSLSDANHVSVTFLDKNPQALEYSKALLRESSLYADDRYDFTWVNGTAGSYLDSQTSKFNIVEMVGLLDYFDDEKAVSIFQKIRNIIESGGTFITANICDNRERRFMTRAIGWEMVYRSADDLGRLLLKAGFKDDELNLYYEP
ncbi:MAG: class I SAM-dependent methyltransferase, partial [Patescibacteria group bacterium]|nr:class I SAM-dependent methyltransferase [Patescibacteria group bacterium]